MENRTGVRKTITEGFPGQKMIVVSPDLIGRMKANDLARQLYPTAIGYYPHASFHERERKSGSGQYILLYCINGNGWIRVGDAQFELIANTFFILPKHAPHNYGSSRKDPWSIYWVHFTGDTADLLFSRYNNDVNSIVFDEDRILLFDAIFQLVENNLDHRTMELLYIKLLQFLSAFVYDDAINFEKTSDKIADSMNFMKENLGKKLSVKDLARQAHYSVSRYTELFRGKTGYSPNQYFLQLKIQKSCQYLYFTQMNIKEICKEIGFDDPYYFSRMFKQQMNMSPVNYRKKYRG